MMQNNQGPGGLIRPNNASVKVPSEGAMPGVAARGNPGMGTMQPQDPMAMYRSFVEGGQSTQATTIKWEQYGQGGGYDAGLQEIANASGPDQDSIQYLASQVVQANIMFMQHIIARTGKFYEVYRQTLESFRRNEQGAPCGVRDAFVTMFSRHHEFNRPVAINASPLFGWRLIHIKRETGREELLANQYFAAAEIAIRSILFLEMVNWLMKTPEGQVHARQLPRDLAEKMPNLDKMNDVLSQACAAFNVNNSYAGMKFEVKTPARTDLHNLRYESGADYLYGSNGMNTQVEQNSDMKDVFEMIRKGAREYRGESTGFREQGVKSMFVEEERWNTIRNDLNNLTPANRKDFQLNRFFYHIGKPNHYVIPETDWKQIKHAFAKHREMGQEETVLPGCFRIVVIDLENDTGWFSRVVRKEGLDMPTVLTDPTKLLPLLEENDSGFMSVASYAIEEVINPDKPMAIELDAFNKLTAALPVITVKTPVVSNSSKEFESTLETVNNRLTGKIKTANAIAFKGQVWDTFTCANPEDKQRLYYDLPFLFKDGKLEKQPDMFNACKKMLDYFKQDIVSRELRDFVDERLTKMVNDYFINAGGYDPFPHQKHHLSITSLIRDYDELDQHLERTDEMMFRLFNQKDKPNYLTEGLKLFTYEHPFKADSEELSTIEKIAREQELVLERTLAVTFVNHKGGPTYTEANVPVVMKRSIFPEYFDVIEKGFEPTMGDQSIEVTDKLICFTQNSENLWLFSYSAIDKNMATLRHVSRRQPLCLLDLD